MFRDKTKLTRLSKHERNGKHDNLNPGRMKQGVRRRFKPTGPNPWISEHKVPNASFEEKARHH
jgi:hypothetical protein